MRAYDAAQPALVVLIFLSIGASIGAGWYHDRLQTQRNKDLIEQVQEFNVRQLETFCGIMESIGWPPLEVGGPSTEYGKNNQIRWQEGSVRLGCTPDTTDGK